MNFNFLLKKSSIILLLVLLNSCSSNDDNTNGNDDKNQQTHLPIIISLAGLDVELEDTSFSVSSFDFKVNKAVSYVSEFNDDDEQPLEGILLSSEMYAEGDIPNSIELDLSSVSGISKITILMSNSCPSGCTIIQTLNSDYSVLQELNNTSTIPLGFSQVVLNDISQSISFLKILSAHSYLYSITLE